MLKYLFEVIYKDGSSYQQTPEDKSMTMEGKSAFYDVDLPNVRFFILRSEENEIILDLITGQFSVNKAVVKIHSEDDILASEPELIFFRRHHEHQIRSATGTEYKSDPIRYRLGYKGVLKRDGSTFERVMEFE